AGEVQRLDLVEVAAGAAGDEADGAEGLVGGTHDLAEGGRGHRAVEVLEDDDGRAGQPGERGDLLGQAGVDVAGPGRRRRAEGGRAGVADHRRQLGVAGLDAAVHVAGRAR